MQNIEGSAIKSLIHLLRELEMWQKVSADLKPNYQTILSDVILPSQWYPLEAYLHLLEVTAKYAGDDPTFGLTIGRRVITDGLKTYYRILLGILSTTYVLSKAPILWKGYFNTEILTIIDVGDKYLKVSVSDQSGSIRINKAYCFSVLGGILQTIETVGGKNVTSQEVLCRCNNDAACEYHINWD
jgi:hypothetical protein